jgi:hypothetical protein
VIHQSDDLGGELTSFLADRLGEAEGAIGEDAKRILERGSREGEQLRAAIRIDQDAGFVLSKAGLALACHMAGFLAGVRHGAMKHRRGS